MSQELERVYTIPLGKVLLSPDNRRAKRAINMIKEFARHHMKIEDIRIEEDVSHLIWSRGIRSPPRKIRVRMTRIEGGSILVSLYDEEAEAKAKAKDPKSKETPDKPESTEEKAPKETPDKESEDTPKEITDLKESASEDTPKETPDKESKDTPKEPESPKEIPDKESKDTPKESEAPKETPDKKSTESKNN